MSNLITALKDYGLELQDGCLNLPHWVKRIKIDVGLAFNAPNSEIWLRENDDLLVFGFEPVSENFNALNIGTQESLHVDPNRIGKSFLPLRFAVGEVAGEVEMYVTSQDLGCSSLLEPKSFEVAHKEIVEVVRLDSLLSIIPWDKIEIIEHIKTDCQGTDLGVVKSAGEYISRVLAITVEPDDYSYESSNNSYLNIARYLRSFGFVNLESPNVTLSVLSKATSRLNFLNPVKRIVRNIIYKRQKLSLKKIEVHDPTFINSALMHEYGDSLAHVKQKG